MGADRRNGGQAPHQGSRSPRAGRSRTAAAAGTSPCSAIASTQPAEVDAAGRGPRPSPRDGRRSARPPGTRRPRAPVISASTARGGRLRLRPARHRHDAEGAEQVAAFLHLQEGARLAVERPRTEGADRRLAATVADDDAVRERYACTASTIASSAIQPDDVIDGVELRRLLRLGLRVAARQRSRAPPGSPAAPAAPGAGSRRRRRRSRCRS